MLIKDSHKIIYKIDLKTQILYNLTVQEVNQNGQC